MSPATRGAVLFDFDGTLAHLPTDYARMRTRVAALYEPAGFVDPFQQILETIERGTSHVAATLGPQAAQDLRDAALQLVVDEEAEGGAAATVAPGAHEAIAALESASVRWAVVTRNHAACVRGVIDRLGMPRPSVLVARDHVRRAKPDPESGRVALARLDAQAALSLVVGDTRHDVLMGKALGCRTVLVAHPGGRTVDVEPDWRIPDLHALAPLVLSGNLALA